MALMDCFRSIPIRNIVRLFLTIRSNGQKIIIRYVKKNTSNSFGKEGKICGQNNHVFLGSGRYIMDDRIFFKATTKRKPSLERTVGVFLRIKNIEFHVRIVPIYPEICGCEAKNSDKYMITESTKISKKIQAENRKITKYIVLKARVLFKK